MTELIFFALFISYLSLLAINVWL